MRKLLTVCLSILIGMSAFAQKIKPEYVELQPEMEKQFQSAKTITIVGSVIELAAATSTLAGVIVTGGEKAQQAGKICKIAGSAGMLLGAGLIWAGASKIHKIKTSTGQTLASISFDTGQYGSGLIVRF